MPTHVESPFEPKQRLYGYPEYVKSESRLLKMFPHFEGTVRMIHHRTSATRTAMMMLISLFASIGTNVDAQSATAEQEVLDRQKQRFNAAMEQDTAALESMLAEELRYCHTTGSVDTKSTLLETIRTGQIRWLEMNPIGMEARVYGNVGVVAGEIQQTITVNGRQEPIDLHIRTIDVYVKRDGRWQLTEFQASRMRN